MQGSAALSCKDSSLAIAMTQSPLSMRTWSLCPFPRFASPVPLEADIGPWHFKPPIASEQLVNCIGVPLVRLVEMPPRYASSCENLKWCAGDLCRSPFRAAWCHVIVSSVSNLHRTGAFFFA